MTAQLFHDENSGLGCNRSQGTLAGLGIRTDHLLESEISRPGSSIIGATSEIPTAAVLNTDKNMIIFSLCNIYFEARRHAAAHK